MITVNDQDVLTFHDCLALCRAHTKLSLKTDEIGAVLFEEPFDTARLVAELQAIRTSDNGSLAPLCDNVLEALGVQKTFGRATFSGMDKKEGAAYAGVYQHLQKADKYYLPKVKRALKMMFSAKQVAKTKKAPKTLNTKALEDVFKSMYHDGYFVGAQFAKEQLPKKVKRAKIKPSDIPAPEMSFNWDTWEPGNPEAAAVLGDAGPGLTGLLDDAGVTIKGISDATLQEIEDTLAYAIEQGSSADVLASALAEIVGEDRADLIANTEMTRAVSAATEDSYTANGFTQFNWLPASDACDECEGLGEDGPYEVGSDEMPPHHPRCRCTITPVSETLGESNSALDDEGE